MKITKDEKSIPNGWYYVKFRDYYIYDSKPIILEYLPDLFSQRSANAYILKFKDRFYVFIYEKGKLEVFEKDSIDDLLVLYPNAVVKEDKFLKKSKLKTKGVKISKRNLLLFMVLFSAVIGLFSLYTYRKKQEEELLAKRKLEKQLEEVRKQMPQIKCFTNLPFFIENYVPYAEIKEGALLVDTGKKKWGKQVKMVPAKPLKKGSSIKVFGNYVANETENGYEIMIEDYYDCLRFIQANSDRPIIIRRITNEKKGAFSCEFIISWDCISRG